jgi:hypothetical protein
MSKMIKLPGGAWVEYFDYIPKCDNCGVETAFCSPCFYLRFTANYKVRLWGETEGLVNRRWQMRFNRGELPDEHSVSGPKWERKRKDQDW